ncbi:MAG: histone deacetylase family protein [Burkholderiaceae bacterium]
MSLPKSAYISHPSSLQHEMGAHHPECPDRVAAIADRLVMRGVLDLMDPFEAPRASPEQISRAHDARHLLELQALSPTSGYATVDPDTAMNPATFEAALHAAGAVVLATELVLEGGYKRAFCNVRPPGHHAGRAAASGFCFFNNVTIGIRHALDVMGLERVALIDFDVHHGNGSEEIVAGDERVLMVSTFQTQLYPFSGERPSAANLCNVALAPYGDGVPLRAAVDEQWLPVLRAFAPQMIFVSAGFDAHREDEMSHLQWRDEDYDWLTRRIVAFADSHCDGRIVSSLEGGYHLGALARCAELHVRALIGMDG